VALSVRVSRSQPIQVRTVKLESPFA